MVLVEDRRSRRNTPWHKYALNVHPPKNRVCFRGLFLHKSTLLEFIVGHSQSFANHFRIASCDPCLEQYRNGGSEKRIGDKQKQLFWREILGKNQFHRFLVSCMVTNENDPIHERRRSSLGLDDHNGEVFFFPWLENTFCKSCTHPCPIVFFCRNDPDHGLNTFRTSRTQNEQ